jgi:LuxR family transcriptional regulator, maltose regulon positive regulatory protein
MDKAYAISKTTYPALPPTVLHRPALVSALNDAIIPPISTSAGQRSPYKVVLLCAAAGYGKTMLLADFARHTKIPCCWYFLERADADEIRFLELLLFSIRQRFPKFGALLDVRLATARETSTDITLKSYSLEAFIEALISALQREISERFVPMLCNYHEINHNQVIAALVNRFIHHLPPLCTLVLESRAQPNLDFSPLLARGEMFGMGSADLRFHADEIQQLARLQKGLELTHAEAAQIEQSLDGWITGILLSTRLGDVRLPQADTMNTGDSDWRTPAMRTERRFLLAYLAREVFAREADSYAFLREVSILRQMTPGLCNRLLSIQDAADRLTHLEKQGLFVFHKEERKGVLYSCIPILRELLREELQTLFPERFTALQLRAVEIFRDLQDYEQAIHHAFSIPAYDIAAELIAYVYERMFAQGYSTTLADWIDALPPETMSQHGRLLLARANIFLTTGDFAHAESLLAAADKAIKSNTDETAKLRVEILIARAALLFQSCEYHQAQEVSWQVLDMLDANEANLRAEVYLRLGVCGCMLCDFAAGIVAFRQALQLKLNGRETRQIARLHNALANAYDMVGLHTLSEHHRVRALRCWEHLDEIWGKVDSFVGSGLTKRLQGNYSEAERLFREAIQMAQGNVHYLPGEAYALVNLGETYLDQGYYQQALQVLEDGLALAVRLDDDYLKSYTLCILARTYLLMGDGQTPLFLLNQVDEQLPSQEQEHTYVFRLCELTRAAIQLQQEHYKEACDCLIKLEQSFQSTGLKRELLQVTIGLAACLEIQGDVPGMIEKVKKAVELADQHGYKLFCLVELERCDSLRRAVQSLAETARLYAFLRSDAKIVSVPNVLLTASQTLDAPVIDVYNRPPVYERDSSPSLRILALGVPEVYLNDVLVKYWRMAQTLEVFFFLLHAGKPVHKEQIGIALWPDTDNSTDQAVRSCIYYLRKILSRHCIISHGGTYELQLSNVYSDNIWYDVQIFHKYHKLAKDAINTNNDVNARKFFNEMALLYRGDYVSSFYSDWCSAERSKLKDIYIDVHYQLALIAWRSQQFDECISHWHHLLAIDSCLEEAHLGLMNCYLKQEKRGLALRQYRMCVDILNQELSVQPGPAIQTLYQSLIADS